MFNHISNKQFLTAVFGEVDHLNYWTTSFKKYPGDWSGNLTKIDQVPEDPNSNNYFSVSLFDPNRTPSGRTIGNFKAMGCLVLDDVSKVALKPSWKIETSPDNYQLGFILKDPIDDPELAKRLLNQIQQKALVLQNDRAGNNIVRYVRLPVGSNTKGGKSFRQVLQEFDPEIKYSLDQIISGLGLDRDYIFGIKKQALDTFGSSDRFGAGVDVSEMVREIVSSEHYYEPCLKLTSHLISTGVPAKSAKEIVEGAMLAVEQKPSDWQHYFDKIPSMVQGAEEKFGNQTLDTRIEVGELERLFPKVVINSTVPRAPNFVIDGLFTDEIFSIAGAPGSGKSSMLFQLAMAAAHLCPDDYELKPLLRRKVVYLTEDSRQAEDIVFGMKRWGGVDKSAQEIDEWLTIIEVTRVKPEILGALIEWKSRTDTVVQKGVEGRSVNVPPLIVFDTAAATFDLENESANSEVSNAISRVKQACAVFNTPLWIIAHTPKVQRNDVKDLSVRGAGAWTGDVHGTAYVFKPDDEKSNQRYLSLGKARFEPDFTELEFDTQTHSILAEHELGHFVEKRYRVGLSRKSSSEERESKKRMKEESKDLELGLTILSAVETLKNQKQKVSKIAVKKLVKGKAQVISQKINDLINEKELVILENQTLDFGVGELVETFKRAQK